MSATNDMELVREFTERNSESAFAELVGRHINLVYSVARRFTGNAADAEDIAQAVFVILARKADGLRGRTVLTGWMYETTRLAALQFLRNRARRHQHEQEAHMEIMLESTDNAWPQIVPLLEEAMSRLSEKDRTLLALRYFENRTAAETAAALGIGEWAAHKRAARALEKLRKYFFTRGVESTSAIIAESISANSLQPAPHALTAAVTAIALAKGTVASASALTLIKGALKIMAWKQAQTAIVAGIVILTAGSAAVALGGRTSGRTLSDTPQKGEFQFSWPAADKDAWEVAPLDQQWLHKAPAQVVVRPTKFSNFLGSAHGEDDQGIGIAMDAQYLILAAYQLNKQHVEFAATLPGGKYDYIANLPSGSGKALQQEIKKQLGLTGHFEPRTKDVFVLRVRDTNSLKFTPRNSGDQAGMWFKTDDAFHWSGQPTSQLVNWLEGFFGKPIVDNTGLTNLGDYNFDLEWTKQDLLNRDSEKLKRALEKVGFELVPTNCAIDTLIIERAH